MNVKTIFGSLLKMFVAFFFIIAIFLVIYRYVGLNSWDDLWNALVMPKVWLSLLIALIFVLSVQVIFVVSYAESKGSFVPSGLTLWLLAIISIVVLSVVPVEPTKQIGLTGLLLATVSIGTGFISLGLTNRSQEKTTAMANQGLYEKMAIIQQYLQDMSEPDSDTFNRAYADRIFYEIKAARELQRISNGKVAKMLNTELQNLANKIPSEEKYKPLVARLNQLKEGDTMKTATDDAKYKKVESLYKEADALRKDAHSKWQQALSGKLTVSEVSQYYLIKIAEALKDMAFQIEDYSMQIQGKPLEINPEDVGRYRELIKIVQRILP